MWALYRFFNSAILFKAFFQGVVGRVPCEAAVSASLVGTSVHSKSSFTNPINSLAIVSMIEALCSIAQR
jgi:hypothetical protein